VPSLCNVHVTSVHRLKQRMWQFNLSAVERFGAIRQRRPFTAKFAKSAKKNNYIKRFLCDGGGQRRLRLRCE